MKKINKVRVIKKSKNVRKSSKKISLYNFVNYQLEKHETEIKDKIFRNMGGV